MDPVEAFRDWVRRVMSHTRFHRMYACEVVEQEDDYTLSLRPDDPTIAGDGISGVPIRHGVPGIKVQVAAGARVQLGFENGDPEKRYAALFEDDPDSVISVDFEPGGLHAPVARVGDSVDVFIDTGIPIFITGTLVNGAAFTGTFTLMGPCLGIIGGPGNGKLRA